MAVVFLNELPSFAFEENVVEVQIEFKWPVELSSLGLDCTAITISQWNEYNYNDAIFLRGIIIIPGLRETLVMIWGTETSS